jgi:acyl dehydratase
MRETSKADRGLITFEKEVVNQRGEIVQRGTTTVLVARRNQGMIKKEEALR